MKKKDKPLYALVNQHSNRNLKKEVYNIIYDRTFLIVSMKFEDYPEAIPDKVFDKWWQDTIKGIMNSL